MGDLSNDVCNDCGRDHPPLEYCDHYLHLPIDPDWVPLNKAAGHHPKIARDAYVAGTTAPLQMGYNRNPPRAWEDYGVTLHDGTTAPVQVFPHRPTKGETIVAAAIRIPVGEDWRSEEWRGERRYPDYLIISAPPPARHPTLMHPFADYHDRAIGPKDQGFLTSKGRYVDRVEAKQIVKESNQPYRLTPQMKDGYPELYSEDLW